MKKLLLLFAMAGMITSCSTNTMMTDHSAASKAGLQKFYDDVFNGHNTAALDSFCTADFVDHNPSPGHSGKGMEDVRAELKELMTAYPDLHVTTNMMIANGDTVMAMITMTGTNSGPMGGMPATNKKINISIMDCIVMKDGKATDRWGMSEEMKMMQQLGMMPAPGAMPGTPNMTSK